MDKDLKKDSSHTDTKLAVSRSLELETLAVIVKSTEGKYFQLALTKEMIHALSIDLKNYFNGGILKILPTELKGIEFEMPNCA